MTAEVKINQHLQTLPIELSALVGQIRKEILETTKPTYELAAQSTQSFNIGYGYTRKAWDCFVAIIAYQKHVNLSFPSGAYLEDGHNILIGKGSRVRHIRINSLEDLHQHDVVQIIQDARAYAISKMPQDFESSNAVQTFVR